MRGGKRQNAGRKPVESVRIRVPAEYLSEVQALIERLNAAKHAADMKSGSEIKAPPPLKTGPTIKAPCSDAVPPVALKSSPKIKPASRNVQSHLKSGPEIKQPKERRLKAVPEIKAPPPAPPASPYPVLSPEQLKRFRVWLELTGFHRSRTQARRETQSPKACKDVFCEAAYFVHPKQRRVIADLYRLYGYSSLLDDP